MGAAVLIVSELRNEVAELLTGAGLQAFAYAPTVFQAPGAVLDLDDPFITFEGTYGTATLHLNVYLLVNPSPKWEDEVLVMVGRALNALQGSVSVDSFQLYDTVEINGTTRIFKGALIKIAAEVAIKEMI